MQQANPLGDSRVHLRACSVLLIAKLTLIACGLAAAPCKKNSALFSLCKSGFFNESGGALVECVLVRTDLEGRGWGDEDR